MPQTHFTGSTMEVKEVCLNNIVYYYTKGHRMAALAPKIVISDSKPVYQVCK